MNFKMKNYTQHRESSFFSSNFRLTILPSGTESKNQRESLLLLYIFAFFHFHLIGPTFLDSSGPQVKLISVRTWFTSSCVLPLQLDVLFFRWLGATVSASRSLRTRDIVLILDDSSIHRPWAYDHAENRFIKGCRLLSSCWSDGASLVPVYFVLLFFAKEINRDQDVIKRFDNRTCDDKRRREAVCKSTELIEPILRSALAFGINAKYFGPFGFAVGSGIM